MKKRTLEISYKDIPNYYHEDEDGRVLQNDPTVRLVLIDTPIHEANENEEEAGDQFSMTEEEENYYSNPDNFYDGKDYWGYTEVDYKNFDNEDYENEDYTPYSRWASYKIIHQYVRIRWFEQDLFILHTCAYIKKRIRLLASPINDTLGFLKAEHTRILSLFDELGPMADLAFHKTHSKSADFILNKVWHKQDPDELPFGDHWTPEELRRTPQSHWCDDDVWGWDEFWEKAMPLLVNYHKAKTYLIMIRFLQRFIRLCEENNTLGYKAIMQKSSNSYFQEAIEGYTSLQPPSFPIIRAIEDIYESALNRLRILKVLETTVQTNIQQDIPTTSTDFNFERIEDLFTDKTPSVIKACIGVLINNNGKFDLIDANGNWLGNKKRNRVSLLSAWIKALSDECLIEHISDKKRILPALENLFPGLKLGKDASQFYRESDVYLNYVPFFRQKIKEYMQGQRSKSRS